MKIFDIRRIALITAGLSALFSCVQPEVEPDPIAPVFPSEEIQKTILAGESVEVSFEANQEWKVSVSGEGSGNMFWLNDEGMKRTSISSSKTGSQKVEVVFSEVEEFDRKRTCEVNLEMAGQEKRIAVINRLPKTRTTEFYVGEADEIDFKKSSGRYVFSQTSVKEGELVTFEGLVTYTLPVKVVTNYDWSMAMPDWISAKVVYPVPEGTVSTVSGKAGETELLLTAILSSDVVAGADDKIRIIDGANSSSIEEFNIVLPAFDDRFEFSINSETFNLNGQVLMPNGSFSEEPSPAIAYVLAPEGTRVFALEVNEGKHTGAAQWLEILNEFDPVAGYLQSFPVQFSVGENTGLARTADIFVLPPKFKDLAIENLCDNSTCAVKEEYARYKVSTISQEGIIPPYITPLSTEELMLEVGTYYTILEATAEENVMQWDFPVAPSYHRFIYTTPYSHEEATFECFEPFAKCVLYNDADYPNGLFTQKVESSDYWLEFVAMENNTKGRFNILDVPSASTQTAAVFYDDQENILACVLIRYDAASSGTDELVLSLQAGEGELVKLGEESEIYQVFASEYSVTDVYSLSTSSPEGVLLSSSEVPASVNINQAVAPFPAYTSAPFKVELIESLILFDNSEVKETVSAVIVLKDENMLNRAVIYYNFIYIPEENPGEGGENPGEGGENPGEGGENPGEGGENPGEGGENPGEGGENPGEGGENPGEGGENPGNDVEDKPIEVDPAQIFTLEVGSAELVKLDAESELLKKVYKKFEITQVYQVTTLSKMTTILLNSSYEVYGGMKLDPNTLEELAGGTVSMEPMSQNIVMYSGGATSRQEALYVLFAEGNVPIAAVHYIFDPYADIELKPAFEFVFPDNVSGATLSRYTGEDLNTYLDEFYGVEPHNVYELVYTVPAPTRANITVPSQPADGASWNNYPPSANYWLTYTKVNATTILVKMTNPKAGAKDHFVFRTSDGLFSHVLICTYKPAN